MPDKLAILIGRAMVSGPQKVLSRNCGKILNDSITLIDKAGVQVYSVYEYMLIYRITRYQILNGVVINGQK
ncbi:hypothetical protein D3C74_187100 [compost metagenome]